MNKFKQLRKIAGLTQEDVAKHLGLSKTAIQKWEYGETNPSIEFWEKISELYKIRRETLLDICEGNKASVGRDGTAQVVGGNLVLGSDDFPTESHRYAHNLIMKLDEETVTKVIQFILSNK